MAWMKVETSVARHRKFVNAGPAASWLWVCGLAYCKEGMTDGFIPDEAVDFLGVREARPLIPALVAAGLWDEVEGGWQLHDFLDHNQSAADISITTKRRADGGKLGGRPPSKDPKRPHKKPSVEPSDKPSLKPQGLKGQNLTGNPDLVDRVDREETDPVREFAMDAAARELVNLYPAKGRCAWNLIEHPLYQVLTSDSAVDPAVAWDALKGRLEQQKRSDQWQTKGMVPRLDRWLREGFHLQELPAASPESGGAGLNADHLEARQRYKSMRFGQ